MSAKAIFILVILAAFLVVLLQNTQVVELRLLFWKISMSRIILFPLTLFLGIVIGLILGRTFWHKKISKTDTLSN
ncbi:MAG: lipopolysaccharide assembly protein LapA domain-containing protein [Candidatus Cloacimonetes bacterium]|nr:lipopolysaccharide assembly protein LapA domain-containing protein [Candidatus Cloacimonadota bacterium]